MAAAELNSSDIIGSRGKDLIILMHEFVLKSRLVSRSEIVASHSKNALRRSARSALWKSLGITLAAGLACFWVFKTARAEEKPPLRLTLKEAVQLALKQNPQVQIAVLSVAQNQQDRNIARSALLPQASLSATEQRQRLNIEALFGSRFPGIPQHIGPFETFQGGPTFAMPLFDLTLWRRLKAAHFAVNAAEAQQQGVREQIVLLTVSQYLGSLRAAADVKSAQSEVELAQALYNQAADLQKNGVGTGIDTLRANVQLQNQKQRLLIAQTQLQTSLYALSRLLSLEPQQPIELTDQVKFFETPEIQIDQSLARAYSTRPEMKGLLYQDSIARAQKQAASEAMLPRLRFDGNWGYLGLTLPRSIPSYTYRATLDVPLTTGGRIRAETTRANLEIKKIAQQKQDLQNQIALEVKTAFAQLQSARNEVDVANLGVKLAEEELTQARDRFQAGVVNNIEVITAQDELARANSNQIAALDRYNQARADLAHATGQAESVYTQ